MVKECQHRTKKVEIKVRILLRYAISLPYHLSHMIDTYSCMCDDPFDCQGSPNEKLRGKVLKIMVAHWIHKAIYNACTKRDLISMQVIKQHRKMK